MQLQISAKGKSFGYEISHDNSAVFMPARSFSRAAKSKDGPWHELSSFLKATNQNHVTRLFSLFVEMEAMMDEESTSALLEKTQETIVEIDAMFPAHLFDIHYDTDMISIPKDITSNQEVYRSDDYYQKLTYTPLDYRNIVLLSLQLRLYAPVIGMVLDSLLDAGHVKAEIAAWNLFRNTTLWEHPAIGRLETFIDIIIKTQPVKTSEPHIDTMSSELIPLHIKALVMFRKLIHYDISDETLNIVSHIYKYTDAQPKALQRAAGGEIRERRSPKSESDKAKLDSRHFVHTVTNIADETAYRVEAEDLESLILNLPSSIVTKQTLPEVKRLLKILTFNRARLSGGMSIAPWQYALIYMAYRETPMIYLKTLGPELLNVIAVAQYVYIKLNHPVFAALLVGQPDPDKTNRVISSAHMKPGVLKQLGDQYHHFAISRNDNSKERPRSLPKSLNVIVSAAIAQPLTNLTEGVLEGEPAYLDLHLSSIRSEIGVCLLAVNDIYSQSK